MESTTKNVQPPIPSKRYTGARVILEWFGLLSFVQEMQSKDLSGPESPRMIESS